MDHVRDLFPPPLQNTWHNKNCPETSKSCDRIGLDGYSLELNVAKKHHSWPVSCNYTRTMLSPKTKHSGIPISINHIFYLISA